MSSQLIPRLQIIAGAALFSTGGIAIKATAATGWTVSGARAGIAAVVLLICLPAARSSLIVPRVWLVAIPYAATVTLFVLASKYTTAANTIFLQDTAPLYLLLLGPWLLKEVIRSRDIVYMAVLFVGLVMILMGDENAQPTASDPLLGNILAACAGVSWAFTIAGMRWLARGKDVSLGAVAAGNILALFVAAPFVGPLSQLAGIDWVLLLYLGAIQIAFAYVLVTKGMRVVTAFSAALLLLVEPVLTPIWAWLFLGEVPGVLSLAAGVLIVGTTVAFMSLSRARDGASVS